MPQLNYNHLYYFHVVAAEGSIGRAAQRLGVAQPTISEQLQKLERTLDVKLFDRGRTGLELTNEGRQAFSYTSIMFQAAERLVAEIASHGQPPTTLRIGITASASRTVATDVLKPVLRLESCVPSVRTGVSVEMIQRLRDRELDLVLTEDPLTALDDLQVIVLHRPRLVAIAPKDAAPERMAALPIVHYLPGSPLRTEVDRHLAERERDVSVLAETDDALLMLECVTQGLASAIVPLVTARHALREGKVALVEVLPDTHITLVAVMRDGAHDRQAQRAVDEILRFVRAELEEEAR